MMCTSSYRTTGWGQTHGWGRGRRGSPFMLIAGILIVAAIFKSGLWLPLLGLGMMAFLFTRMNSGWQPGGWQRGPWQPGWGPEGGEEKPKRPFGPMNGRPWYGHFEPEGEKPKRGQQDDEYV